MLKIDNYVTPRCKVFFCIIRDLQTQVLSKLIELWGAIRALDLLAIGMVNDIYVESRNDGGLEAYVELAAQADFDHF